MMRMIFGLELKNRFDESKHVSSYDASTFFSPCKTKGFDSIWVIIDRLTKIAHFLSVKVKYTVATYAELYIARILSLHGVLKTIVSDRGPQFVSKFWEELHKALGTKFLHSSAYHPQTSG
jgi:hypothetical protein